MVVALGISLRKQKIALCFLQKLIFNLKQLVHILDKTRIAMRKTMRKQGFYDSPTLSGKEMAVEAMWCERGSKATGVK